MKGHLTTNSFASIDSDLDDVIDWIKSFNLDVASTRIQRYRRALRVVREIQETKINSQAEAMFPDAINILHEIHDLIEIQKGFAVDDHRKYLTPRIADLISGPDAYTDEDSSSGNKARNTPFELLIASRLARKRLPLTPRGSSDIATRVNSKIVVIECKRPFAEKKVARRIKDGFSQLKRTYKGADAIRTRGIVAVDVTRSHNPQFVRLPIASQNNWAESLVNVCLRSRIITVKFSRRAQTKRQLA